MAGYDLNNDETLITDENLTDFLYQDLEGCKALLECEEFSLIPILDPTEIEPSWKICVCGESLLEGPKNEFRCGSCGCIQYKRREGK